MNIKGAKDDLRLMIPAIKTAGIAAFTFVLSIGLHIMKNPSAITLDPVNVVLSIPLVILGFCYALLVEYAHHRFVLHRQKAGIMQNFTNDHTLHHNLFRGEQYQTRDPARLQHVATYWPTFPTLYLAHFLPASIVSEIVGIPFVVLALSFAGIALGFIYFELTHFVLHLKDSPINTALNGRRKQLRHRIHHQLITGYFGVTTGVFDNILHTTKRR